MILVQFIYVCDGPDHHTEVGHDVAELYPVDCHERPPAPKLLAGWVQTDQGKMLCSTCAGREPLVAEYSGPTDEVMKS